MARETPSMTVGPWFAYGLVPAGYGRPEPLSNVVAGPAASGAPITLTGQVLDARRQPVTDALVEVWQADADGRYRRTPLTPGEDGFRGHGRCASDATGHYHFTTIKPGAAAGHAPHVNMVVFARGMLNHQFTRLHFADEKAANRQDPLLKAAGIRGRTLIAAGPEAAPGRPPAYRFDIRFGGRDETVFLDA